MREIITTQWVYQFHLPRDTSHLTNDYISDFEIFENEIYATGVSKRGTTFNNIIGDIFLSKHNINNGEIDWIKTINFSDDRSPSIALNGNNIFLAGVAYAPYFL